MTKRKSAYKKLSGFYSQEEDFDVLFFGSSHVLSGIYPMELWDDYGIVSYNMGQTGELTMTSYYNIQLALKEKNCKLVVIDAWNISNQENNIQYLHDSLDTYPISYTKFQAVKDLLGTENLLENCFEYLSTFSIYHARWSELAESDFLEDVNNEKGVFTRVNVTTPEEVSDFETVEMYNGEETCQMIYLRKIIEYCKKNNVEVLITYLPNQSSDADIAASKYVQIICDEYDVSYINFLNKDVININIDYDDSSGNNCHLNPSGARKVTNYLGQYIMENYDIQDKRENEAYSFWYEDYDEYIDVKIERLKTYKGVINTSLMLLYGEEDISYEIKVSSTLEIEEGSTLKYLLENLENNYEIDDEVFLDQEDKTIKITTWDNRTGEEIQTAWF